MTRTRRVRCRLCPSSPTDGPPVARRAPHDHVLHGVTRPDPYAWMSPADGEHPPELLAHLAAERGWYDVATSHLFSWASVVRSEMVARVPEERRSGTWSRMRFSYYTRDARDRDYTVIWRESRNDFASPGAESSAETASDDDFAGVTGPEVVLDVNTLDAGTGYLDLGLSIVSPDEHLLAYSLDTSGNEVFTLRFRDLRTGADLPDVVEGVGYTGAWTSDSSGNLAFLYTVPDASWRHERIRAHRLGDDRGGRRRRAGGARPPLRGVPPAVPQRAGHRGAQRVPRHHGGVVRRPDRRRPGPPLARRPADRGDVPRRARPGR